MDECAAILKAIMKKPEAGPFLEPVEWEAYGLTDYPEIIKKPMDLGTVQTKLEAGRYGGSTEKFAADVRLVWKNAMAYNRQDSEIWTTADNLSRVFEKKFAKIKKSVAPAKRKRKSERLPQITRDDRLKFANLVNQLSSADLGELLDLLKENCPDALNDEDEQHIMIEINNIDTQSLINMMQFCNRCLTTRKRKK